MNDDPLEKLLKELVRSEHAPPLSDAMVDGYLLLPAGIPQSPEVTKRIRARYAMKVLESFRNEPIRTVPDNLSFGSCLHKLRTEAALTCEDIASALDTEAGYVERLESGTAFAWTIPAREFVRLMMLFQIHIEALQRLITVSFSISRTDMSGQVAARSHGGKISTERGDVTNRALQMYLARNAKPITIDSNVTEWLNGIRQELERGGTTGLL